MQLVDWLVVRVFYAVTDFMMLNTVNLSGFVTLSTLLFVTPHQIIHGLLINTKGDRLELDSLHTHCFDCFTIVAHALPFCQPLFIITHHGVTY